MTWTQDQERTIAGLLPAGMRCSAFWYATARGLPAGLGYLKALGLTAYRIAAWEGLEPWQVPEGPYRVYMWPERIWDAASAGVAREQYWHAPPPPGYGFWSYPAPPEGTQAYADWQAMADAGYGNSPGVASCNDYDERDAGWGPGQVPWDGDDIR